MTREEGERWVVDLVRDARLDAKIDFKQVCSASLARRADAQQNTVQMNHTETPVYQSVIERSKGLLFRAQAMSSAMEIRAAGGTVDRDQKRGDGSGRGRGGRGRGGRGESGATVEV